MILYRCPNEDCGWTPNGPADISTPGLPPRWICANCGRVYEHEPRTDWPFAQRDATPDPHALFDALEHGARHRPTHSTQPVTMYRCPLHNKLTTREARDDDDCTCRHPLDRVPESPRRVAQDG